MLDVPHNLCNMPLVLQREELDRCRCGRRGRRRHVGGRLADVPTNFADRANVSSGSAGRDRSDDEAGPAPQFGKNCSETVQIATSAVFSEGARDYSDFTVPRAL